MEPSLLLVLVGALVLGHQLVKALGEISRLRRGELDPELGGQLAPGERDAFAMELASLDLDRSIGRLGGAADQAEVEGEAADALLGEQRRAEQVARREQDLRRAIERELQGATAGAAGKGKGKGKSAPAKPPAAAASGAGACAACGREHGPDARFCAGCGAALGGLCPGCGAEVASDARFCKRCGHRVAN